MTQHPQLFAALAAPFDSNEVKVRTTAGRKLSYITARTVMNRLDNVVGPENWWDRYIPGENSVLCELTIRLPDGSTLTKCDAGGYPGMADSGDDDKGGHSDAFKRAAVKFGVARYLYRDGVASFQLPVASNKPATGNGRLTTENCQPATALNGKARTEWPGKGAGTAGVAVETRAPDNRRRRGADGPETGGQLYAWLCQEQRRRRNSTLLKRVTEWANERGWPPRMTHWEPGQVEQGYAEACRILQEASRGT